MLHQKPENVSPQGKQNVFFTCHPEDHDKYFEKIYEDIRKFSNCIVWYSTEEYDENDDITLLERMNIFVVPITTKLLLNPSCRTLKYDVPYAIKNKKPILPLMLENGLDELYGKYFSKLQYLDPNSQDSTSISYDEKLKKYLNANLINDELASMIRSAFDAYIFLSYRKKDRKYANELMQLIHQNDFCRDIAIWYDEYLEPGENFNKAILKAIQKSELFTMVVTPNLVNEDNYIRTDEYPAALHQKKILPIEMEQTNYDLLIEQYPEIPKCIDGYNNIELTNALESSLLEITCRENDGDPQHNFFIGLAYLNGIDVEINLERALQLITSAAESNKVPEAIVKLVEMYQFGVGVGQDDDIAVEWQKKLVVYWEKQFQKTNAERDYKFLLDALLSLGDQFFQKGEIQDAETSYKRMLNLYNNGLKICTKTIDDNQDLAIIYERLSDVYMEKWDVIVASTYLRKSITLCEHIFEIKDTNNVRRLLLSLYKKLGKIYQDEGNQNQAESILLKALALGEYLVKAEDTLESRRKLAGCYEAIGCFYDERGFEDDYRKAKQFYTKMYNLYERLKDAEGTVVDWTNLMYSFELLGRFHEKNCDLITAEKFYKRAENVYKSMLVTHDETIKNKFFELCLYERFGDLNIKKENYDLAEKYYRKKFALDNDIIKKK